MSSPSPFLLSLVLGALAHAGGFHLVGSTWKLQSAGASASTFTAYRYDNAGHRIRETVYAPDSMGTIGGETFFEYDQGGRLARTIVLANGDTSSIAIVSRDSKDRILATTVFAANNALRYVDSNAFRGDFLERTWRTNATGRILSLHRFDSIPGVSTMDSLFALDGSDKLAPVQVKVAKLETSGRVSSEASWQCSDAICYRTGTRKMAYSGYRLQSVVGWEGDGTGGALVDSIHFGYDEHDNRVSEDWFDADRSPTQSWIHTWAPDPISWLRARPASARPVGISIVGRELTVPRAAVSLALLDHRGRVHWSRNLAGEDRIVLPASLAVVSYLATILLPRGRLASQLLVGD